MPAYVGEGERARRPTLLSWIEPRAGVLAFELHHSARTHEDPMSQKASRNRPSKTAPPEPPPEAVEAMRAFKAKHYAEWPDHPMPALSGQTPRRAVKTARGRALVAALLDDMQRVESQQPAGMAHDFSVLRRELGL